MRLSSGECIPDATAGRAPLAAVEPGWMLLIRVRTPTKRKGPGSTQPITSWPPMTSARVNDNWEIELDEQRPRITPAGGTGADHAEDLLIRATAALSTLRLAVCGDFDQHCGRLAPRAVHRAA